MTCIPDRTSLQASFYTPPDIPRQESNSTTVPSPSCDQIFTQTSCYSQKTAISCLERPNLNSPHLLGKLVKWKLEGDRAITFKADSAAPATLKPATGQEQKTQPTTPIPQLTGLQLIPPPAPALDGIRQQFQPVGQPPVRLNTPTVNNQEIIQALGRLESVIKDTRVLNYNQTLNTTNRFESNAATNGTFAQTIEDQLRSSLYDISPELERWAT